LQSKERLSEERLCHPRAGAFGRSEPRARIPAVREEIAERRKAGEGLTRPELAITLSYGKIWLYKALIQSNVPEDPICRPNSRATSRLRCSERFAARFKRHRLRREIIATAITNSLINRMGPVFPVRAQDDTGAEPAAIARAYTIAREVFFAVRDIWAQIEAARQPHRPAPCSTRRCGKPRGCCAHELLAAGEPAPVRSRHRARGAADAI
jgi:hypothetical protein